MSHIGSLLDNEVSSIKSVLRLEISNLVNRLKGVPGSAEGKALSMMREAFERAEDLEIALQELIYPDK